MSDLNPKMTDVIVIGGGPVGENVAERVVKGGLQAIVVEAELVGGECSYWACMPSKALLRPGAALEAARRVAGASQAVTGKLDVQAVLDRRTSFTENWDDSSQVKWLDGAGIQLVRGGGRISGERTVDIAMGDGSTQRLEARQAVVLATGSVPHDPKIAGLDSVSYWGTREATSAKSIPNRLTVLGGGVSGTELAQAFSRLGSKVTIVARSGLLGMFPKPASDLVLNALRSEGIDVRLNTGTRAVSQVAEGVIRLELGDGEFIESDALLVSTGRKPALDNLGLEDVGLTDLKLNVGDDGRVENVEGGWLYAVGDAAGKVLLTHQGKYEARLTGDAIAARAAGTLGNDVEPWSPYSATADVFAVPQVVYTDPELVMVGRTAQQAEQAGIRTRTVELEMQVAGTSLHADGYKGWAQIVVDEGRQVIVGATLAGQDVSEMLHAATIAVVGEVPLARLWHAVPSYPTMSEVWLRLLEAYGL